jgi:hypothetical protein
MMELQLPFGGGVYKRYATSAIPINKIIPSLRWPLSSIALPRAAIEDNAPVKVRYRAVSDPWPVPMNRPRYLPNHVLGTENELSRPFVEGAGRAWRAYRRPGCDAPESPVGAQERRSAGAQEPLGARPAPDDCHGRHGSRSPARPMFAVNQTPAGCSGGARCSRRDPWPPTAGNVASSRSSGILREDTPRRESSSG